MALFLRGRIFWLAAPLIGVLAACSVTLVSAYDEQIDIGLSQLNTDLDIFVTKMIQAAGTPAGTYAQNRDFYITEEAKVDTLILRAQAHQALASCPATTVIKGALAAVPASGNSVIKAANVGQVMQTLPQADCAVVLLRLVRGGLDDLEKFHKAQGAKGIPAFVHDPILVGGEGALIRAAITVELAKKATVATGGK
jgi:hypothetical protein